MSKEEYIVCITKMLQGLGAVQLKRIFDFTHQIFVK